MARFLAEKKISFDAIFHSPKLRAKQTAELIASKAAPHLSLQEKEGLKPNDPIEPFLSEILHEEGSLLLAGHLPFITSLISYLLFRKDTPLFLNLCAASVTCLMRVENSWIIDWHVTPQLL